MFARILLTTLLFILAFTSYAADTEELAPLIISAPLHQKVAETVHPVNILSGNDLALKQASTIGETLKQELGIHNTSFGGNVGQAVIRGQMGTRVQVLQNSLGSLDVSGVSPDHASSSNPLLAERIEVLRGPASLLYGSGAIGGIVNVIDNRIPRALPESANTEIEQRYNSVSNAWSSALKHDGSSDKIAWHIDGSYHQNDNYHVPQASNGLSFVDNTDAQSWSGTVGSSWIDQWGMIGISINHLENDYGIPPIDELVRIDVKQTRYDLKAELYDPIDNIEIIKFRFAYNDYQHVELEDKINIGTQFNNQGLDARLELVHNNLAFLEHGAWGFQIQNKKLKAIGEEAFVPPSKVQNYAFFLVEDIHSGAFTYEFGLRIEQQIIDAEGFSRQLHTPISASLSALWHATDNSTVSLAFTHSQRAPDVQELFADGVHFAAQSYEQGDENLDLETSYNLEFSFKSDWNWVSSELNLFHNWSKNYIIQQNTGTWFDLDNETFNASCPTNADCLSVYQAAQQDARFYGFEAQLDFPIWQNTDNQFSLNLFSDFVRGELVAGGNVPRMPPLRYGLQLNYAGFDAWETNLRLTRAEKQKHAGENESTTPGYLLLDIGVNYNTRIANKVDALVFIKATNLLNETIRNSTSILRDIAPEAGRGAEIGLRIKF